MESGDQQPSSPAKPRKMRGGKKVDKFDKAASSESGASAATSSQDSPIEKDMCALESWLECSADHLEGGLLKHSYSNTMLSLLCFILVQGQTLLWINPSRLPAYAGSFLF
jgi:hypothetical protein